jgi:hypothetical protein
VFVPVAVLAQDFKVGGVNQDALDHQVDHAVPVDPLPVMDFQLQLPTPRHGLLPAAPLTAVTLPLERRSPLPRP